MEAVKEKAQLQKFSDYKDSGAEWLGKVPEDWKILKVKNVFRLVTEPAPTNNSYELLSVYTDIGVKPRKELEERGNKASTTDGYWLVQRGDVIVNKLLAWMGAIGVSDYDGVTSPAYDILRAKADINSRFYHYLFRNPSCIQELKKHSRGIMEMRLRLYFDKFGDILIPYPEPVEQEKIVLFLDKKCDKIETAIAQKEKLIGLLKERKQIIIQNAVTKGLDPEVKMKESGVEWIGEIPEHWEVKKITHLFSKIGSGTTPTSGDIRYYDGPINYLQTGDLNDGVISSTSKTLKQKALKEFSSLKVYPKRSLVIAMYGATIGKLGILEIETATNQACCVLGETENVDIQFIFHSFLGFRKEIISMGYGGGQPNISQDLIKSLRFPIPTDIKEQEQIVSFINNQSVKIDNSISLQQQQIEKLKEYKSSLIDAAVTGKIKVS